MSAYAEVSIVVDGALDGATIFHDDTLMHEAIAEVVEDAKSDGYPTEVFVMFHEHDEDQDTCECAQYETDHRPKVTINAETEGVWETINSQAEGQVI